MEKKKVKVCSLCTAKTSVFNSAKGFFNNARPRNFPRNHKAARWEWKVYKREGERIKKKKKGREKEARVRGSITRWVVVAA